jgi:hypothetical protein
MLERVALLCSSVIGRFKNGKLKIKMGKGVADKKDIACCSPDLQPGGLGHKSGRK